MQNQGAVQPAFAMALRHFLEAFQQYEVPIVHGALAPCRGGYDARWFARMR